MTNKWREIRLSAEAILPAGPDNLPITHANELGEMIEPVTLAACMLLWLHFRPSAHCRFLKKLTRIIRDFHWHGRKDAKSGSCLVSWQRICRPLEYDRSEAVVDIQIQRTASHLFVTEVLLFWLMIQISISVMRTHYIIFFLKK